MKHPHAWSALSRADRSHQGRDAGQDDLGKAEYLGTGSEVVAVSLVRGNGSETSKENPKNTDHGRTMPTLVLTFLLPCYYILVVPRFGVLIQVPLSVFHFQM